MHKQNEGNILTAAKLSALKQAELELFRHFLAICADEQLTWFVIGGTALGAGRHGGFIPWDDDIDVGMPRRDYEKFLSIAQEKLPEGIFLQTNQTEPDYPCCFAKLRDSNTTFIERSVSNLHINHGVYLDIFPLDGYPKCPVWAWMTFAEKKFLSIAVSSAFCQDEIGQRSRKGTIAYKIAKRLYPDYRLAVRKMEKLIKRLSYEKSELVCNFGGAWGKKEAMPKEVFGTPCRKTFEGLTVNLPENTDEYLTRLYGDYRKLPPAEKRIPHHFCTVIDMEKPYTDYRKTEGKQ